MSSGDAAIREDDRESNRDDDRGDRPGSYGEHVLQKRFGTEDRADRFYDSEMQATLTDRMQSFLAERWTGFVGWLDDGRPRVTPAVDGPGMVQVLDSETVAWPAGTMIGPTPTLDGSQEERWLSLVTVDWFDTTVGLHINGVGERVEYVYNQQHERLPGTDWIVLSVEEAYIHCAKHAPQLSVEQLPLAEAARDPIEKSFGRLSKRAQRFVGSRLQAVLGTADADGETDVSPRLGPAGFVQVLDESTLAWPEYRGNGVHASLGNMYERPVATLSFVDWWSTEAILEVSGTVSLEDEVDDATDLTDVDQTKTWVSLEVDSVGLVTNPPLPRLSLEEFDPPWGTDDASIKKSGYFTD
ncbi:pyridoxamine 5'-phosphate oxidase family protein [Natrinema salinisoli]|uniref:pyridoxamine 5'-phosphate oxidase family protein n=1 Tax=Natrinema salinisoli TaxID=2878535 RepID=UPI0031B9E586